MTADAPLVEVRGLRKAYDGRRGLWGRITGNPGMLVQAVDGVSFTIGRGRTLGVIGESGCGKSTLGRAVIQLDPPTAGDVRFAGESVVGLGGDALKRLRRRMQIVFQDPYASLNPRKTIGDIIGAPLGWHGIATGAAAGEQVRALMATVGLRPDWTTRYPHEFSGGQRQRIGIARALILEPAFVVCDEPVSALDVSIQAQVLRLLQDLRDRLGLTYLFISHDIAVIASIADEVAVMYLGEIVEIGPTRSVVATPRHPYTQALIAAVPRLSARGRHARVALAGDLPSPADPPSGCRFHTRCPIATPRCRAEKPALRAIGDGHRAACHYAEG